MTARIRFLACLAAALLAVPAFGEGEDTSPVTSPGAEAFFARIDSLPADERFRQLSLMLMVTDGAGAALVDTLVELLGVEHADAAANTAPEFDFDEYSTPLIRIVDQRSMLAGATRLFRFTRAHAGAIAKRLKVAMDEMIEESGAPSSPAIAEDAIIIRNAIADSIDFATLGTAGDAPPLSTDYRARTIYLRNNLEYELFAVELDRITAEAVESVGGKTDAYERMFDDEVDAEALNKKIEAAEYAYGWDRDFDERAAKLAEEILENIWDRESDIDP